MASRLFWSTVVVFVVECFFGSTTLLAQRLPAPKQSWEWAHPIRRCISRILANYVPAWARCQVSTGVGFWFEWLATINREAKMPHRGSGETIYGVQRILPLYSRRARWGIVMPDVKYCGGVLGTRRARPVTPVSS
jgi:hypothetical protein